jgi:hypothetical protein
MAKPPARCIFCGGFGLSKEHVFPGWLKQLFPRSDTDTHIFMEANWHGHASTSRPQIRGQEKQGHSGTRQVRIVCKRCNNSWMSNLEENTKPLLISLITGESVKLNHYQQRLLSRWIAKTSVVAERIPKDGLRIPETDRRWIMEKDDPPQLWSVWIAPYDGLLWPNLRIGQYTGTLEIPAIGAKHMDGDYVKATSFGAGRLFGLCIACKMPVSRPPFLYAPIIQRMHRIWPMSNVDIDWLSISCLGDDEADAAAFSLTHPIRVFP